MNRLRGYVVKLRDHCEQRLFTPLAVNRLRGYLVKFRERRAAAQGHSYVVGAITDQAQSRAISESPRVISESHRVISGHLGASRAILG